jgi:hypothetical protein
MFLWNRMMLHLCVFVFATSGFIQSDVLGMSCDEAFPSAASCGAVILDGVIVPLRSVLESAMIVNVSDEKVSTPPHTAKHQHNPHFTKHRPNHKNTKDHTRHLLKLHVRCHDRSNFNSMTFVSPDNRHSNKLLTPLQTASRRHVLRIFECGSHWPANSKLVGRRLISSTRSISATGVAASHAKQHFRE